MSRLRQEPLAATACWVACALFACKPKPSSDPPEAPPQARASDADRLPPFAVDEEASTEPERYFVALGDAPRLGPDDAPVTIVMFSDFECPFCLQGYETLLELQRRYAGKVRIAYKAFPLDMHPHALVAAMAARSAQAQGRFWEFHNLLFSQQGLDPERLLQYAAAAELDVDRVLRDIDTLEYGPEIRRDLRQARRLGLTSTPTFFINGRAVAGAKPLGEFATIIDEELARAQEWRKQGIAPEKLYDHAIADGWRRVEYAEGSEGLDPDGVYVVPVSESPTRGPATAPLTIVAFEDFECPFCARGHATLEALERLYPGKVRLVFKHSPLQFHSHAFVAARASMAAHAQGKFWAYHDALYRREARFDEDDLQEIAREVGLDLKEFKRAMQSPAIDRRIEADLELAMQLGVSGTPAYFINGRPLEGAVPLLHFRLLIEDELERANASLEQGVAPEDLYDELTHKPLED